MKFERVHTIHDWYDGPRLGIAEFNGRPHIYKSFWNDETNDWETYYYLKPISEESFEYAMENWNIWKRYEKNFYLGKVSFDYHPALPEDQDRYKELEQKLKGFFDIDLTFAIKVKAEFETAKDNKKSLIVSWEKID